MKNLLNILIALLVVKGISQHKVEDNYFLMPWPQEINVTTERFIIDSNLTISINGTDSNRINGAAVNFLRRLSKRTGVFLNKGFPQFNNESSSILVDFTASPELTINVDESYNLEILERKITLKANTDVGALRGLQTLLQLISFDKNGYFFLGASISDSPRFVWRGLMIDAARHFQPVEVIKRNLDAMASVKMNVLHWHLCDDQGFRVESKIFPKLHEIGGDGIYYTQEQIKDVVKYADKLGIRVIPEFDIPGHATAILAAYPEIGSVNGATYNVERDSGIFDPTLNPTLDGTYDFLDKLFSEMAPLFPDEYFHIGGDENLGKHWNANKDIQNFKTKNDLRTNHDLQTYFNIKIEKILNRLGKKLMGWDEILTPDMPTTAVIHSWRGENEGFPKGGTLIEAAKKGYNTVLSAGFYIDRMLSVEHHYSVEPIGNTELTNEERARILGGETTMWSELVTPVTIDSRIWPRTAAIAERFWSSKEVNNIENMRHRLNVVNYRLEELGLTHIKNRDVILRGMTNNQDISSLIVLSKVCEPLKMYSRNQGGTEYKTYSPFTLFADACVADAEDAHAFNKVVSYYLNEDKKGSLKYVLYYLKIWAGNHDQFLKIANNPNVKSLEMLSENLANSSKLLILGLEGKQLTEKELQELKNYINRLKEPVVDVELAIVESFEKLMLFCQE